jgi:hypothetical protein
LSVFAFTKGSSLKELKERMIQQEMEREEDKKGDFTIKKYEKVY